MSRWGRKARPPPGFDYLEPTLAALEAELREKVNEGHEGKRKNESLWPVHQINWQRSRYIFDMFYRYEKISREVYEYCVQML
ncbi:bud site selection protein 31 [Nannochloropsis gaditana CCMP526]|uniref:bud site selection protein 31 n=1 Tax=Nannochloropsis gaditana (strain CCMP526) TaxID=1093141 RepID=UPI00029F6DC5|nr:bud site selection protein 31 [Nannochloropsis gaditana CCMP526]EKU21086.1 bud site selection protein 31 [Nannochloropsis gaditana CCMP526]|eukprot:XP_005855261.1 bud site selection protein 31 [Nannochloropsis gaditana CCMP526]